MSSLIAGLLEPARDGVRLLQAGGQVMVPIAVLSVWMWFLILFKLSELRTARHERLLFKHCRSLPRGADDAPAGNWLSNLLREFYERRCHDPKGDGKLLESLLRRKVVELERHVPTILMLASVAPLLGLLGTVTGMITTFNAISQVGTGNPRPLAAGISEALITTEFGLAVAIPGLMLGGYLQRRVARFRVRLEALRLRLSRVLEIEPMQQPDQLSGESN